MSHSRCALFGPADAFHCAVSAQRGPTKAHRRRAGWLFKDFQHSKAFHEEKRVMFRETCLSTSARKHKVADARAANNRGQICPRRK